ncbi:MAG TPA: MBL fold metallo-hydrolase [Aggregatilineales bacterium]|nr:MBL fold metallo-hydrolase [Aggregatilineales bacterium]
MTTVSRRTLLKAAGSASVAAAIGIVAPAARLRAAQPALPMIGRIVQMPKGDVTVHTYIAPVASFLVTSHIIETPNQLVVVDAQFLQTAAREVRAYAESLGKPIDRVIVSHAHPDHWSGTNIFEDVPVVSTAAVAAGIQADIDGGGIQQRIGLVGESEVPATPLVPEGSLEAGTLTIDGVNMEVRVVANAESPEQAVLRLPDQGVIVLQDLLYSDSHFFPGVDRANWVSVLEGLRTEGGFDTLLAGHGLPASGGELTQAIKYLNFANEVAASATSADEVIAALTAEFPGYDVEGILQFWGLFFQ